jgi:WXG100 family type VII secretion target
MAAEDTFDLTKVNYSGMDAGETDFQTAYNNLIDCLQRLETDLLAKSALWTGDAAGVFQEVRQTWEREGRDMAQFVQLLANNINITKMNMQQVDKVNAQIFDGR